MVRGDFGATAGDLVTGGGSHGYIKIIWFVIKWVTVKTVIVDLPAIIIYRGNCVKITQINRVFCVTKAVFNVR